MFRIAFFSLIMMMIASSASAQLASQKDARNMAVLKAVVNYKINDEENMRDIEKLREDVQFNQRLLRMLDKLSNERTKDAKNKRVLEILEKAGDDLYRELR